MSMYRSILVRSQETPANTQFSLGFVAVLVVWGNAFKIVLSMSWWCQGLVNFQFGYICSFVALETLGILRAMTKFYYLQWCRFCVHGILL